MKQIPLTKGKFALVDDEDFDRLVEMGKWCVSCEKGMFYAVRGYRVNGKVKIVRMHRFLLNLHDPKILADHINGDSLDNRKQNIRACDNTQNSRNQKKPKNNTSGFKGVSFKKSRKKYVACIEVSKKNIYLGIFTFPIDAARAYNAAAYKHFGEFARLNELPNE